MAFLDDLLSNARWLDKYLGTQADQNPNLTADETQRSPAPKAAEAKSFAAWLSSMGLLGAGPQGTSPGILRPAANANGASGVDETGFNLAYPGQAQSPPNAAPTAQGAIPGGPSYYSSPFGGLQIPTAGNQPETVDMSAAPKRAPLPVQSLVPQEPPSGQALPSPYQPQGQDLFSRLQAGAYNMNTGGNSIAGLLNAVQGLTTGVRTDPTGIALAQQGQMANFLYRHLVGAEKMDPQKAAVFAPMLALDPELRKEYLQNPKNIEQLIATRMRTGGASATEGLQALQQVEAAKSQGQETGKEVAQNVLKEPAIIQGAKDSVAVAQQLLKHPGRDNPLFWHNPMAGLFTDESAARAASGTEAGNAIALANQLKGGAFNEVYQGLRGGGQISNIEGSKATQAILRFSRATTKAEGDQALKDFISHSQRAIENAQFKAGHAAPTYQPTIQQSGSTKLGIPWKVIGQ